jgi:prophage regulatory protein
LKQTIKMAQATSPATPLFGRLLRIKAIKDLTGLPQSSFYYTMAQGEFTPPIKLGVRISAWPESEVNAIMNARIRGESSEQIKALVKRLVALRMTAGTIGGAA